jgi:hypothetical protein
VESNILWGALLVIQQWWAFLDFAQFLFFPLLWEMDNNIIHDAMKA